MKFKYILSLFIINFFILSIKSQTLNDPLTDNLPSTLEFQKQDVVETIYDSESIRMFNRKVIQQSGLAIASNDAINTYFRCVIDDQSTAYGWSPNNYLEVDQKPDIFIGPFKELIPKFAAIDCLGDQNCLESIQYKKQTKKANKLFYEATFNRKSMLTKFKNEYLKIRIIEVFSWNKAYLIKFSYLSKEEKKWENEMNWILEHLRK